MPTLGYLIDELNKIFKHRPSLGNWTFHPSDPATLVNLETKETLVQYTGSKQDAEFILFMYMNFENLKKVVQDISNKMDDLVIKTQNAQTDAGALKTTTDTLRQRYKALIQKHTQARSCIAGLSSDNLLLQGEAIKLADSIIQEPFNEEAIEGFI